MGGEAIFVSLKDPCCILGAPFEMRFGTHRPNTTRGKAATWTSLIPNTVTVTDNPSVVHTAPMLPYLWCQP